MEGLSAAASGIAVFSIAIQLAESVKKLCCVQNMNFSLYENNIIFTKASIVHKNIYTTNKGARLY